jgi:hypothetical protein
MLEVREGVQCTPCTMIERGNFEPLSHRPTTSRNNVQSLGNVGRHFKVNYYNRYLNPNFPLGLGCFLKRF